MEKTINLVGYLKKEIISFFSKVDVKLKEIEFSAYERYYETTVNMKGSDVMQEEFEDVYRRFKETFKSYIYGENADNIFTHTYNVLKEKNIRVAFCEGVSAGRLASELVCHSGSDIGEYLIESYVNLTKESQMRRFGILPKFYERNKLESVEAVYEQARGGLFVSGADVVVATSGTASDEEIEDNGKCFIAVGNSRVINVFKHSFTGSKNKIMQQIAKYACLHLLKNI